MPVRPAAGKIVAKSKAKERPHSEPPPKSGLGLNILVAVLAAGIGSGVTWFVLESGRPEPMASLPSPIAEPPPDVSHLSPSEAAAQLGHWHYDRERWPQAIQQYEAALRLGLDTPDVHTDLGNCYRFTGQASRALEQYQIAQRKNPQHRNSLYNMGGLYAEVLNDPAKAKATLEEYLRRFPQGEDSEKAKALLARMGNDQPSGNVEELLRKVAGEGK